MRLIGRSAEAVEIDEEPLGDDPAAAAAPAPPQPDYAQLGQHVASVLNAAEEAAQQIRADAREEAVRIREEAEQDASISMREAAHRRQEAEQDARRTLAEAEAEGRATREAAESAARESEAAARRRMEDLREEIRGIEEHRQRALYELRDIASQLQNVLLDAPGPREGEAPRTAEERTGEGLDEPDSLDDPATEAIGLERD